MHPYKVVYLESNKLVKVRQWQTNGSSIDGVDTAKALEALLIEQAKAGYELVSITPLSGTYYKTSGVTSQCTTGFMVTFKELHQE